jgi:NAD+ diphosphatase
VDPLRDIPLCAGTHDRAAPRRRDDAWLAEARQAATTRVVAVRGASDLLVEAASRLAAVDPRALPAEAELTFLGVDEAGAAVFVLDAEEAEPAKSPHEFQELRLAGAALPAGDAALAVQAVAMVNWHRRHRFCGVCGGPTQSEEAGHSRRCASCGAQHFPRTDPAVIMLVAAGDRCVLSRRPGSPANRWTVLSGFVEPGETPEAAVVREVSEEVGVRVTRARYLGSQPWPFPASLMLGYEAEADYGELAIDEELVDARWFSRAEIHAAIRDGSLLFPPSVSISRQLIWTWLHQR